MAIKKEKREEGKEIQEKDFDAFEKEVWYMRLLEVGRGEEERGRKRKKQV